MVPGLFSQAQQGELWVTQSHLTAKRKKNLSSALTWEVSRGLVMNRILSFSRLFFWNYPRIIINNDEGWTQAFLSEVASASPGTSTDVSRYAGQYEHVFEATTAGVTLQAPQLDINTVAAGGGSRLFFRSAIPHHFFFYVFVFCMRTLSFK